MPEVRRMIRWFEKAPTDKMVGEVCSAILVAVGIHDGAKAISHQMSQAEEEAQKKANAWNFPPDAINEIIAQGTQPPSYWSQH